MSAATAWLIIITSAWSGQATRSVEFPTMEVCRTALSEMKIADSGKGTSVVAFCSPTKPGFGAP